MSKSSVMQDFFSSVKSFSLPKPGTLVEGQIIDVIDNKILVDLMGIATGIITGKESSIATKQLKELKQGEPISAYVMDEDEEGYFLLSLKKANLEQTWKNLLKIHDEGEIITVTTTDANKGGLLVAGDGVKGFIPVSQLAPLHYPRVDGANSAEILARLRKLVGEKLKVKILTIDRAEEKLIFSEKAALEDERAEAFSKLKVGDIVEGYISGIVKFGIFVTFNGLEGLVHISEIEWGHVKDPFTYGKVGDKVQVKIISIDGDKISLSMKQLMPDPWKDAAKNFKIEKVVEGVVDRMTQFGVFLKLENDLSGLIHLSELSYEPVKDPARFVKIGDHLKAKVIAIDPDERRIGLSLKALQEPQPTLIDAPKDEKEAAKTAKEEIVLKKTSTKKKTK